MDGYDRLDGAFGEEDGVCGKAERCAGRYAHQRRPGKGVEHQFPAGSRQLPAGLGLSRLPGCRDERADQRIVIINIHPQVEFGLGKRYRLL